MIFLLVIFEICALYQILKLYSIFQCKIYVMCYSFILIYNSWQKSNETGNTVSNLATLLMDILGRKQLGRSKNIQVC